MWFTMPSDSALIFALFKSAKMCQVAWPQKGEWSLWTPAGGFPVRLRRERQCLRKIIQLWKKPQQAAQKCSRAVVCRVFARGC